MIALPLMLSACLYIPVNELDTRLDPDGDGSPWPQDCAPDDPEASPLEVERCGDAIDNDCDGSPAVCSVQFANDAWFRLDGDDRNVGSQLAALHFTGGVLPDVLFTGQDRDGWFVAIVAADASVGNAGDGDGYVTSSVAVTEPNIWGMPDLNEDGYDDLVVGVPEYGTDGGGAYFMTFGPALEGNFWGVAYEGSGYPYAVGTAVHYGGFDEGAGGHTMLVGFPGGNENGSVAVTHHLANAYAGRTPDIYTGFVGTRSSGRIGVSVAFAGDVDGDGEDDRWIGAPDADDDVGTLWWVPGPLPTRYRGENVDAVSTGFDGSEPDMGLGTKILGAVDFDGDGYMDAATTAPGAACGGYMRGAIIVYGGSHAGPRQRTSICGIQDRSGEGTQIGSVQNFWGDNTGNSIMVGVPFADTAFVDAGIVRVFRPGFPVDGRLSDAAFSMDGDEDAMGLGAAVVDIGDREGDGWPDIAVGAPGANGGAGAVLFTDVGY